ncbi:MAG: division/cell wall cluster transcriptional repressor MraZ [Clostridia bacterium]|nr:division/cell wall cluster transcriptional repressor MraZ [Clostridia bacterium]
MLTPFVHNGESKLDGQRRFTVPAADRDAVGKTAFIYKPPQFDCLYIYNAETWESVYSDRVEATRNMPDGESVRRKFVSRMTSVDVDSGYRITIPLKMFEKAMLKKDIVILGSGKHMELWDAEIYRVQVEEAENEYDTDSGFVM